MPIPTISLEGKTVEVMSEKGVIKVPLDCRHKVVCQIANVSINTLLGNMTPLSDIRVSWELPKYGWKKIEIGVERSEKTLEKFLQEKSEGVFDVCVRDGSIFHAIAVIDGDIHPEETVCLSWKVTSYNKWVKE